jgi:hypothetical protein
MHDLFARRDESRSWPWETYRKSDRGTQRYPGVSVRPLRHVYPTSQLATALHPPKPDLKER